MLYVQKIGLGVRSNCTYSCRICLRCPFLLLYVQKIGLGARSNCTYSRQTFLLYDKAPLDLFDAGMVFFIQ